jgi:hypothetical protein
MSTNETLFTIFSLAFLTFLIIRFYGTASLSFDTASNSQAIISATGYAQSLVEEISLRKFDENTVSADIDTTASLTNSSTLGPDAGEYSVSQYDDIDDFKNYTRVDSSNGMGTFTSKVNVFYVSQSNLTDSTTTKSFLKKISVVTTNKFLFGSVKLEYIVNY